MILKDFLPNPALREFIQCYRICHFEFGESINIPVKACAPKPEQILHFFLGELWIQKIGGEKYGQSSIAFFGQRTSLVHQFTKGHFVNVHIVFQPTAVFRLTGIPANELTDQHYDATLIFHKDFQFTLEQLHQAKDYTEMLYTIENFSFELIRKSQKDKQPVDTVSQKMKQNVGNISLDALANDACLCTKQFERKFYERVGVNPKTYAKIVRFNKAYNLKNAYPNRDWLGIAMECDYYDYQNLVKDYKDFTSLTPNEFQFFRKPLPRKDSWAYR